MIIIIFHDVSATCMPHHKWNRTGKKLVSDFLLLPLLNPNSAYLVYLLVHFTFTWLFRGRHVTWKYRQQYQSFQVSKEKILNTMSIFVTRRIISYLGKYTFNVLKHTWYDTEEKNDVIQEAIQSACKHFFSYFFLAQTCT